MSVQAIAVQESLETLQAGAVDGLVAGYFDKAFLTFNLFVDDPRTCLDLSEGVFRLLEHSGNVTEQGFFSQLAAMVRDLPAKNEVLAGVESDSVLCWLLKDSSGLSYAEIAGAMGLQRSDVQARIADVRMALLD